MRRVLFAAVVLAMLLGSFSVAFADGPQLPEGVTPQMPDQTIPALLGDVWWFLGGGYYPFERVDVYMYRPSTLAGWPWLIGPDYGTWWWTGPDSELRRMSFAEDWLYADEFGWYYAEFMLPRDEAWFPCSFPLKWKCNYQVDPWTIEWHSPAAMAYECIGLYCLDWPWAVAPYDTVSPVEIWMIGENALAPVPSPVYAWPFEVLGYYWKYSDIP